VSRIPAHSVIDAWQQIWKMTTADFGGKRAYRADFEVYDERARDPTNTSLDIYVGIIS
jgi:predicted transcriptional regulator YdeE